MVQDDGQSHRVIAGRSGSGKTTFYRERIFKTSRQRIIFFNTQHESGFGPPVKKWSPALLAKPGAKVNFEPPILSASANGLDALRVALARIVDDCIAIGRRAVPSGDRVCRVRVAVDEAHLISPKGSPDDALQRIATNGARFGMRFDAITQRPAKVSHTVLSQASTHVLFDLDDYEAPYLDHYGVPDHARQWISETLPGSQPGAPNRRFAVRQGKTWTLCNPIKA